MMFSFRMRLLFVSSVIALGHVNFDVANNNNLKQTQSVNEPKNDKVGFKQNHIKSMEPAEAMALQIHDLYINHLQQYYKIQSVEDEKILGGKVTVMKHHVIPRYPTVAMALQNQDGRPINHPNPSYKILKVQLEKIKDGKVTDIKNLYSAKHQTAAKVLLNQIDHPINYAEQSDELHKAELENIRNGRIIDPYLKTVEPRATFTPPNHAKRSQNAPAHNKVEFTVVPL